MLCKRIVAIASAGLVCACSGNPEPVTLLAERAEVETLVGEWYGSYSSSGGGRSGSIVFKVTSADSVARGDVLMVPSRSGHASAQGTRVGPAAAGRPSEVLSIEFVLVAGNQVIGTLSPYRDPDDGSLLTTTFEGRLEADIIEGSFMSRDSDGRLTQRGSWRVTRRPD